MIWHKVGFRARLPLRIFLLEGPEFLLSFQFLLVLLCLVILPVPNTIEVILQTEEDRRQRHLAELTADSDVKAPGMWQRFKEEIQAIAQNIYEKIWRTKKDEQTSSA